MQVRLGISPISWMNDDLPEISVDLTLEECFAEARGAGYAGVEYGRRFPSTVETLGPLLAGADLSLVSGWFSGELLAGDLAREIDRLQPQIELFRELGAPVLFYGETHRSVQGARNTPMSARPRLEEEDFGHYGRNLTRLAEHCADQGVMFSFHHHVGTVIEDMRDVDRLMAHTGEAVGLLFDAGHMLLAGDDPMEMVGRYGSRINHFHAKDVRADILGRVDRDSWSFLDAVLAGAFTVPGDGCINFDLACRLLLDVGYEGWAVVEAEQDPANAPPAEFALKGRITLEAALRRAGYEVIG